MYYKNSYIVDRLSLAYLKYDDKDKAIKLLKSALQENIINNDFYSKQIKKFHVLEIGLPKLYEKNSKYEQNAEHSQAIVVEDNLVIGFPTSKDIFDTKRAVDTFKEWFEMDKDKYPEFINLFLCLMAVDNRQYK